MELAAAVEPDLDGGRLDRGRVERQPWQRRRQVPRRRRDVEIAARTLEAVAAAERTLVLGPAREVHALEREVGVNDRRRAVDSDRRPDGKVGPKSVHAGERLLRPREDRTASLAAAARADEQHRGQDQEGDFHGPERRAGVSGAVPNVSA